MKPAIHISICFQIGKKCAEVCLTVVVRRLTGHATGGGHLGVTMFATGGGTRKFFPIFCNFSAFWREQSPVANTLTPKCPPPIACPVRHDFFQKIFMG